jgi:outer membrane protein OmpA-like peptidoglycan-associated protein
MQGKDPFLILLGLFILSTTFFLCGKGSVTSPPPVTLEYPAGIPTPVSNIIEPPSSPPPLPSISAPAVFNKKIDELLIGNTIAFRINSATLLTEGKTILNNVASILHENPTVAFEVGGHTDNLGSEHANGLLLEQRAKAVVEYLISQRIAVERLTPKGYGASRPIAESATDERRWHNRRIKFSIDTKGAQP